MLLLVHPSSSVARLHFQEAGRQSEATLSSEEASTCLLGSEFNLPQEFPSMHTEVLREQMQG